MQAIVLIFALLLLDTTVCDVTTQHGSLSDHDVTTDFNDAIRSNTTKEYGSSDYDVTSAVSDAIVLKLNTSDDVTNSDRLATERPITTAGEVTCHLVTADRSLHRTLTNLLNVEGATLITYRLNFVNRTDNPLTSGDDVDGYIEGGFNYRADRWSRVTTAHGQTLLSLAFNYGVLSMMTLTFGTEELQVDLVDSPPGCFDSTSSETRLPLQARIDAVRDLLMRDLDADGPIVAIDEARVCHELLVNETGKAKFRHSCCYLSSVSGLVECSIDIGNTWLNLLYGLLFVVRLALLFFGPMLFIRAVESMAVKNVPYVVKLKDPLDMTVLFCSSESKVADQFRCRRKLNLRPMKGLPKFRDSVARSGAEFGLAAVPIDRPVRVRFSQYDINIDYKRTLTENYVDVGVMRSLFRSIFECQLRTVGPFRLCCKADMLCSSSCRCCRQRSTRTVMPWIRCWRAFASVLLVVAVVPFPYYIRLALFYAYEYDELRHRKEAIAASGLTEAYENSLIHYLLPTHWLFVVMYLVYFLMAVALAIFGKRSGDHHHENRLKKILVGSFDDLQRLAWTDTLSMAVANVIWPFRRFGLLGCLVGVVYWPIAIPLTAIVCLVYVLPTLYLTVRIAFFSKSAIFEKARRRKKNRPYQVNVRRDQNMFRFQADSVLIIGDNNEDFNPDSANDDDLGLEDVEYISADHLKRTIKDNISLASSIIKYQTTDWRRVVEYIASAVLCMAALYSVVVIQSEVVGCIVEIGVFTIMGIIVNASALLKYIMLVLMIFVYCCDCFNNVQKKYLKLNKALFNEVKSRIKDLSDVTSLPSSLQENRGFKSQELSEQADYESPDEVADLPARHWMINDLVLFVDSEDTPRIPRQLFDEVCNIRVAGVPGPVFRGHIEAVTQLAKIILFIMFVFLIVLSFSAVYRVSTTNQMLATMVGAFLPMVLRTFLSPPAPDVELGTVSFKSKMDEVIKNFCQYWPIYDLPFALVPPPSDTVEDTEDNEDKTLTANVDIKNISGPDQSSVRSTSTAAAICPAPILPASDGLYGFHGDLARVHHGLYSGMSMDIPDGRGHTTPATTVTLGYDEFVEDLKKTSRQNSRSKRVVRVEEPEDVDLIVYLPDKYDEPWLDEWSDIISMRSRTNSVSVAKQ